ncbi:hypothetical protein ATO8_03821 [Roseivivax marinus]|jgi:uncharacterized protein (DUF427 family)|uniref:DUF427 domain-containing protein n=1 Tax=Roseivivax marinus TaxID=1379903 RepID=W4HNK6_9RHOB|nr:DUF427 domain-containing protein [Roseivivax marinus]ETW13988.1 hypothetical protein ATO8_03821 [Roseivivax marinus]UMA63739.1 DUF427 domain-containing protein [Roseivivax marinus]SEK91872.1 Uncharacterized conserved protein, DUF427 family [Roseivivax marinus]
MSDDIKIRQADGTWVVRAGGAVLGESANALELSEDGYPDVIYFPRDDIAMAFLDRSDHVTECPKKGTANYYSIMSKSRTYLNAVWTYEDPKDDVARIKGYLAFHPQDGVTVEQL